VPPLSASDSLHQNWTELTKEFDRQNKGDDEDDDDDDTQIAAEEEEDEEGELLDPILTRGPAGRWVFREMPIIESNESIDGRVESIQALASFLIMRRAELESQATSIADVPVDVSEGMWPAHLGRVLPVLLRYVLSIPALHFDILNFPDVTPKSVTRTLIRSTSELASAVPEARILCQKAITLLLQQTAKTVLAREPSPNAARDSAVLEGLLGGLGDAPFPFTSTSAARRVGDALYSLAQVKQSLSPSMYGLTLRAVTNLLAFHNNVYSAQTMKNLFEQEFLKTRFQYPSGAPAPGGQQAAGSAPPTPGNISRRPSIAGASAAAAGLSKDEAAQALILVQTINLGVLVGLIAQSGGPEPNCTPQEEEQIKQQALHKLKEMLDQLLTVQSDPSSSGQPPTGRVVIGCVESSRAILNGVMELASKYRGDNTSIPSIVDAIRTILLTSRRLQSHPKEKHLRYYLILSLSKVFALELRQVHAAGGPSSLATTSQGLGVPSSGLIRSSSQQGISDLRAASTSLSSLSSSLSKDDAAAHRIAPSPSPRGLHKSSSYNALASSSAASQATTFANSFTRQFVQGLLTQLYKEEHPSGVPRKSISGSNGGPASNPPGTKPASQSQRIINMLLDLVALIQFPPLTQLVLPQLMSRFARASISTASSLLPTSAPVAGATGPELQDVIPQLTDIALMEERRFEALLSSGFSEVAASNSAELRNFESIVRLFLSSYYSGSLAAASGASSKKTLIEIPSALARIAGNISSPLIRRSLAKQVLRTVVELSVAIRNEELRLAQLAAEQAKAKHQKGGAVSAAAAVLAAGSKTESCGFLLPILAQLVRDAYADQARGDSAAGPSSTRASSDKPTLRTAGVARPIGLQLWPNPESNVKWFRRLWFFLVSFRLTEGLISTSPSAAAAIEKPDASGSSGHHSNGVAASGGNGGNGAFGDWGDSIRALALYSPLLINTTSYVDFLSTELLREYDIAFKKPEKSSLLGSVRATPAGTGSNPSSLSLPFGASERITAKLNNALAEQYRKALVLLLGNQFGYDVAQMQIGRVLFLLSMFHLEILRAKASAAAGRVAAVAATTPTVGTATTTRLASTTAQQSIGLTPELEGFAPLFQYLSHSAFERIGLQRFVALLAEGPVYSVVSNAIFAGPDARSSPRTAQSERIVAFLLKQMCSRFGAARAAARNFLDRLTNTFTHLQFSTQNLTLLLQIIQAAQESLASTVGLQNVHEALRLSQYGGGRSGGPGSGLLSAAAPPHARSEFAALRDALAFPDELTVRHAIHSDLSALATKWLRSSKMYVPNRTALLAQEYIQRAQRARTSAGVGVGLTLGNLGDPQAAAWHTSLALLLSSAPGLIPSELPGMGAGLEYALAPSVIGALGVKERFLGEIKGMYRTYQEQAQRKRKDWEDSQKALTNNSAGLYRNTKPRSAAEDEKKDDDEDKSSSGRRGIHPPLHSAMRSMSLVIAEESVDAFANLLAKHKVAHSPAPQQQQLTEAPLIPPFGRLLSAKLILEGNQILHSFAAIQAKLYSPPTGSSSGANAEGTPREKSEQLHELHQRFERLLCLTAALLIWATPADSTAGQTFGAGDSLIQPGASDLQIDTQDLLHLVVKAPSQLFTPEALQTSVFVWEWLLSARESAFQLPLLIEMKAAWAYTVDRQVGLFSHRRQTRTKEGSSRSEARSAEAAAGEQQTASGSSEKSLPLVQQNSPPVLSGSMHSTAAKVSLSENAVTVRPSDPTKETKTAEVPDFPRPPPAQPEQQRMKTDESSPRSSISSIEGVGASSSSGGGGVTDPDLEPVWSPNEESMEPHIVWIGFLSRYFEFLPAYSRDVVHVLASMLHKSFARPDLLSTTPQSFGARVRLLHLGVKLIQGGGPRGAAAKSAAPPAGSAPAGGFLDLRDKQLLRDRIYLAALSWFMAPLPGTLLLVLRSCIRTLRYAWNSCEHSTKRRHSGLKLHRERKHLRQQRRRRRRKTLQGTLCLLRELPLLHQQVPPNRELKVSSDSSTSCCSSSATNSIASMHGTTQLVSPLYLLHSVAQLVFLLLRRSQLMGVRCTPLNGKH
jgi:hypothetical protein